METQVKELGKQIFELQPEKISCPAEIIKTLQQVLLENKMPDQINFSISKHDYMYQFLMQHIGNASRASLEYINAGAHMMNILKVIAARKWGDFAKVPVFLDFASGYGRGTVYGIPDFNPVSETALTNPICSHGIVKVTVEKYLHLYRHLRP